MDISIDSVSGDVRIGNVFTVTSSLTPDQVTIEPIYGRPYHHSSLPYKCFTATSEDTQMEFCFFDGLLVHADFHTLKRLSMDDYLPCSEDLLTLEKKRKYSNNYFLRKQFDDPVTVQDHTASTVELDVIYEYQWGVVSSLYKNANAFIRIEYAGRRELAVKNGFMQKKHRQQLSRINSFIESISAKQ